MKPRLRVRQPIPAERQAIAGEQYTVHGETSTIKPRSNVGGELFCVSCCRQLQNELHRELHVSKPAPQRSCLTHVIGTDANHVICLLARSGESYEL